MTTEEIIVKKVTPKKGYLLTNGETITNAIFMGVTEAINAWWEIPDENYIPEYDGTDFLYPITWESNMNVISGLWYTNGENTWEAIKDGIPSSFNDKEYFDIIN